MLVAGACKAYGDDPLSSFAPAPISVRVGYYTLISGEPSMATRSRRTSGNSNAGNAAETRARTASETAATAAAEAMPSLVSQAVNAPTTALHNAWAAWLQLAKAELAAEVNAAQSLLKGAQALREAQLEANHRAQATHEQVAGQIDSTGNLNDVVGLHLALVREDMQGAVNYWTRLSEVTTSATLESFTRGTEALSRLQSSFWGSAMQWSHLAQTDAPGAAEEIEASVDHVVNPLIASPMLWPTQEAAREAMTLANTAWKDWFAWSSGLASRDEAEGGRTSRSVH